MRDRNYLNSAKNVWIWQACDHSQWPGHTQSNAEPGHTYTTNVVTICGVTVVSGQVSSSPAQVPPVDTVDTGHVPGAGLQLTHDM